MLLKLMTELDGRYLRPRERTELRGFLGTVRARRAAYDEIRRTVDPIVDGLIAEMRQLYPEFAKIRPQGFEKGTRDMGLLTRIAANAMLLDADEYYDSMFTEWYRTILKSVHVSPQFLQDTFRAWHGQMERLLSPDTFALLRPHALHMSEFVSAIPVPAKDETGRRNAKPPR